MCTQTLPQRVVQLNLRGQSLVGIITPFIANLTSLTTVDLSRNAFHGVMPQEFGCLRHLQHLNLTHNSLQGEIPVNLTQCSHLRTISLEGNKLVGNIPIELASLPQLVELWLDKNNLTGSIPPSFGNLSSLTVLSLGYNQLVGSIPPDLGQLRNLNLFQVGDNRLSGMIPPPLLNLSSLTHFLAAKNRLSGSLPPDIGLTLPNLRVLYVGGNQLSGPLPISILNASELLGLDLTYNRFTGPVPHLGTLHRLEVLGLGDNGLGGQEDDVDLNFLSSLINCTHLQELTLSGNEFTGVLPRCIVNLSAHLKELRLARNHLSGSIPEGIENLTNLTYLSMGGNRLLGTIPFGIGKLQKLEGLELSGNLFSGHIPSSIGNLTQLTELYLGGNRFQGSIPASLQNCQNLNEVDFSRNYLSSTIPIQLFSISSLSVSLDLSENSLTGSLPLEIGNLKSLSELDVSRNNLTGKIPGTIGDCRSLGSLYLDGNQFEGTIPQSLSSLRGIEQLDLSCNNLGGPIPPFLQELPFLRHLNLSFNDFEGEVPKGGVFRNASVVSLVGNMKLCGGISKFKLPICPNSGSSKQWKMHIFRIVIPVVSAVLFVVLLSCLYLTSPARKLKSIPSTETTHVNQFLHVSFTELLKATNGFSSANLIGVGSHGSVYKGSLKSNEKVAVKVINLQERSAYRSFTAECEALSNIRHRNIVKIVTVCSSLDYEGGNFRALVYKYMPNESLDKWLHPNTEEKHHSRTLSLIQRINIAIDVAFALDYLHHHYHAQIVHCDIKPSNILLDDNMNAYLSDFGLAKVLSECACAKDSSQHKTSSVVVKGTIGYIAPEYGRGGKISTKGDVYCYGILLLEMVTGRRPTDRFKDDQSLHQFARTALDTDRVMENVDPQLLSKDINSIKSSHQATSIINQCLISLMRTGVKCSERLPEERRDMTEVVKMLHQIKDAYLGNVSITK